MSDENVGTDVGNTANEPRPQDLSALLGQLDAANAALAEKEAQYKGLQKTYNTLFESNKALRTEHEALTADSLTLKNQVESLENDQGSFKSQFETLQGEYGKLESKLGELESKSARTDMIIRDYPELLPFEAQGLLPTVEDGDPEALKVKLDAFKETMGERVNKEIDEELDGAGPGNTGGGNAPEPKRADILGKMMRIAGDPEKLGEYQELQGQLDELDAKKDS